MRQKCTMLVFAVLLDVVEAEGEDFHNHFVEDLYPVRILFFFHDNQKRLKKSF